MEPLTATGTATDVVFNLPDNDTPLLGDEARLTQVDATTLRIESTNEIFSLPAPTFELTNFPVPTGSLTINGRDGSDTITLSGSIAPAGWAADLIINAEKIIAEAGSSLVTTGTVNLNASDVQFSTLGFSGAGALYADAGIELNGTTDPTGPKGLKAAADTSTGTLAADTYYYRVTAFVDQSFSDEETFPSAEVKATLSSAGRILVDWDAWTTASGADYRLYRGLSSGDYDGFFTIAAGSVPTYTPVDIASSSVTSPTVITTATAHGLTTGDRIKIAGHEGSLPSLNGFHTVTVTGGTTFTIPVNVTAAGTGGTISRMPGFVDDGGASLTTGTLPEAWLLVPIATATVDVSGATIDTVGDATFEAKSTVAAIAEDKAKANEEENTGDNSGNFDVAFSNSTVVSTATADIQAGSHLTIGGKLEVLATNKVAVGAIGNAKLAGSGAGIALGQAFPTTRASIQGATTTVDATNGLDLIASADTAVEAKATSSRSGASNNGDGNPATTEDSPNARTSKDGNPANGNANTADGSIDFAGALAFTLIVGGSDAFISDAAVDTGTNDQIIRSSVKNTTKAVADGANTGASTGSQVGVGVAVSVVVSTSEAYVDGASLTGAKVNVEAVAPSSASSFLAQATSGVGDSSGVTVAGSLAVNVAITDTTAALRGAVTMGGSGNDLALKATTKAKGSAKALVAKDSFDPAKVVDVEDDTLTLPHRLKKTSGDVQTGDQVRYRTNGGSAIGGLTDDTIYYAIVEDSENPEKIKLATSSSNATAGTAINLTAGAAGTEHSLELLTAPGDSTGVGVSVAVNVGDDDTLATVEDGATATNLDDLELDATTTYEMNTVAENGAAGSTAIAGGVSVAVAVLNTTASIGTGSPLVLGGGLDVEATQNATIVTNAEGNVEGADVAVGVALGLGVSKLTVLATLKRNLTTGGAIRIAATSTYDALTKALASAAGAEGASSDSTDVNQDADSQLAQGNQKSTTNGGTSSGESQTKKAATADGGGSSVSVAAAVSFNILIGSTKVVIPAGLVVDASGSMTLATAASSSSSAVADGSANKSATAVGAAVAVNYTKLDNFSIIESDAQITAEGLLVTAGMRGPPADGRNKIKATAKSGAGGTDIGVAGALALNITEVRTRAVITGGTSSTVNAGSGDITVSAHHAEDVTAKATAKAEGGDVGVGASVALNILIPTETRAEIEDTVSVSGGHNVTISAYSDRCVKTQAEGGSAGGVAVTPVVALLIEKDDTVVARIGTGGSAWLPTGAVKIEAIHVAELSQTSADATAAGDDVAVGADVAINVVVGWGTTAELARSLTADSVEVNAFSNMNSAATATASAKGAEKSDDDADTKANGQVQNNPNANDKGVGTLPSADQETTDANSTASSESGAEGGGVGVAAAIAVNWVVMTNTARIAPNVTVNGTAGDVTVAALDHTDATAHSLGLALCDSGCDANVGAAVGLNVIDVTNTAEIGSGVNVNADGVTVEAATPDGERNEVVVRGLAAAGGDSEVGVAGSIGIVVVDFDTLAKIGIGADVASTGGVTVTAGADFGLQNLAVAGGASTGSAAVGAAISVNVFDDITTEAIIDSSTTPGSITEVDADGAISVEATASLAPVMLSIGDFGAPEDLATATAPDDDVASFTPERPVLILPGIGGTFAANDFIDDWFTERGVAPDNLQIDPLGQYYHDLIRTLRDVGYTLGEDLFAASYDWRMNPGPVDPLLLDSDLTNDNFDGVISGLTADSITDDTYEYGVDYLGYWLKVASEQWFLAHGVYPESVDIIAHSTGGLVARTYIQSGAYDAPTSGGLDLPRVNDLIMVGVPNRGASKAWNVLHNDWDVETAFRIVLSKVVAGAWERLTNPLHADYTGYIEGPDYDILHTALSTDPGPAPNIIAPTELEFITLYIPTGLGLLATYPFVDLGTGLQTVNTNTSGADARNAFLLDLNAGLDRDYTLAQLDASANHSIGGKAPNAFIDLLDGKAVIIYGDGVETPVEAIKRTGPPSADPKEVLLPFTDFTSSEPGASEVWYEDIFRKEGDGTVPTVSAAGQFASDDVHLTSGKLVLIKMTEDDLCCSRPTTLDGIVRKGDVLGHTGLMSMTAAQRAMLLELGLTETTDFVIGTPPAPNDVSFGLWTHPLEALDRAIYFKIIEVPLGLVDLPSLEFLEGIDPQLTTVALSGSGGTSDAAVSGSVIVNVITINTKAKLGPGIKINQNQSGGSGQSLTVSASDDTKLQNLAGAVGLTTGAAGIGVGVVVEVINKHVEASIGSQAKVSAGGNITVDAATTEHILDIAGSAGVSTDTAGVAGSFIVVVLNNDTKAFVAGGTGATLHSGGKVEVSATDDAQDIKLFTGGLAFGSTAGVGVAASILVKTTTVDAYIGSSTSVRAPGAPGVTVKAAQTEDLLLLAIGGAGGGDAGVAGSAVVNVLSGTTKAHIDNSVTIGTPSAPSAGVAVSASDHTDILSIAGQLAIGGTAGVGAGVDVEVVTKTTQAWIGKDTDVDVSGNVTVDAVSSEDLTSISVGGSFAGTAAVTINAGVARVNVTTKAFIADGTSASDGATIDAGGSVRVNADERLDLDVISGNISGGGTAAVGAAAAVPVVTKNTHAYIGNYATVNAAGNGAALTVFTGGYTVTTEATNFGQSAVSGETINLGYNHGWEDGQEVLYDKGYGTAFSGLTDGNVYYVEKVNATSVKLHVNSDLSDTAITIGTGTGTGHRLVPTNEAGVRKDESPRFTASSSTVNTSTNTITLPYALGMLEDQNDDGDVSDPGETINAQTGDAVVYSAGGGTPIGNLVDGETYYVIIDSIGANSTVLRLAATRCGAVTSVADDNCTNASVQPIDLNATGSGKSHSLTVSGGTPSADAGAYGPRTIVLSSGAFRGVAVTASNSDDVAAVGISAGIAGTAAVNLAGSIDVTTVHTSAHIGGSAKVNCGTTCAENVAGANSSQSVRVAAANQYYELGLAATLAIAGTAGVAVPVGVRVVDLTTNAYIGTGTSVNAARDISITADAEDTILSIGVGAGGGTVGVAGTVTVTVLDTFTFACTGTPTDSNQPYRCLGSGATLNAGGNILVSSVDDTVLTQITIAIAGGYVGVGAAVGVAVMNKNTEAYLGGSSTANAQAERDRLGRQPDHPSDLPRPGRASVHQRGHLRPGPGGRWGFRRRGRRSSRHRPRRDHQGIHRAQLTNQHRLRSEHGAVGERFRRGPFRVAHHRRWRGRWLRRRGGRRQYRLRRFLGAGLSRGRWHGPR
jgi:hypothetical protein